MRRTFVQFARTSLIRGSAGLRRMIEEVVCEEFLEQFEVPAALHFFGIPPNDCFRGFSGTDIGHDLSLAVEERCVS